MIFLKLMKAITMFNRRILNGLIMSFILALTSACSLPSDLVHRSEKRMVPKGYSNSFDTVNTARAKWKQFFRDPYLFSLIDTALRNNQELNIILQEINISKNEVRARKGEYLPFVISAAEPELKRLVHTPEQEQLKKMKRSPEENFPILYRII